MAFQPHPLLRSAHLMTIAGAKLPRRLGAFLSAGESFLLPVGEDTRVRVEAHWQPDPGAPTAILVHGLCGDARRGYMAGTAAKAFRAGLSVIRLNLRNAAGTEQLSPTLYHAALTDDLHALVDWVVTERRPQSIVLGGFSLGGSIVSHALADWRENPPGPVRGAAVVSVPWDLEASSVALHRGGLNRLYIRYFMQDFRRLWPLKAARWPERYPPALIRELRTLREFDDRATAPSFGWSGAADYYAAASPVRRLEEIRLPLRVIHAADDPFVPLPIASLVRLRDHPTVEMRWTSHGGHNGFIAARRGSDPDHWWAENRLVEAFSRWVEREEP